MITNDEEDDNLNFVLDEEDGKKYEFDFHALKKLKRRGRIKVDLLICLVVILIGALIVMVVLYVKKQGGKETVKEVEVPNGKQAQRFQDMVKLLQSERMAFEKIGKYGENCHNVTTNKNRTICGQNAYCRRFQHAYRCDCLNGFVGDGVGDCKDVQFAIQFKTPTKKNLPELKRTIFPNTTELSVCFWFKLDDVAYKSNKWMSAFMFTSVEIDGENDLMIWVRKDELHVYLRNEGKSIHEKIFPQGKWTHLCWTWQSTGKWWVYINSKLVNSNLKATQAVFKQPFPASSGNLLFGQDKDEDSINQSEQMFHGSMTQFYIYSKRLSSDEIVSVYENRPPSDNIIVGWWQFKGITRGEDIIETDFPNEILTHKTAL